MLFALACGASTSPTTPASEQEPTGAIVPLGIFGASGTPGAACTGAKFRQFDFWVGNWNIQNPAGAPAGVSVVSRLVAGCAMLEFYQGGSGQSLNSYDASTDTWNQFYVFSQPGILLLRGGLVNGEMVLTEQRGPNSVDRWAWSSTHPDTVWQRQQVTVDGAVQGGFQGRYVRRPDTPAASVPPRTPCPSTGLSFIVGSWRVFEGSPTASGTFRGTMTATAESNNCVIIERVTGGNGFTAISFAARHPQPSRVLREYMDSDGRYLRLSGDVDGANFRMTGSRKALDGTTVSTRVSWASTSGSEFTQTWEFSRDGGTTWGDRREFRFVRQ